MNSIKRFIRFVLLAAVLLPYQPVYAGGFSEVIADKQVFKVGICGFKRNEFKAFAGDFLIAPEAFLDNYKLCIMLIQGQELNPSWFVIVDRNGEPQRILKWTAPAKFEVVWRSGTEI